MDKDLIMHRLSEQTGVEIKFNDMGLARLRFDKEIIVDLELTDDEKAVYIYSSLGAIPNTQKGCNLIQDMMRAHFLGRVSGDTCFGLDNDTLMAFMRYDFATAEQKDLYTALEDFLDSVVTWLDELKNCQ